MPATNLLFKAGSQNPQNQPWLTAQFLGTLQNEVTAPRSSVTHPQTRTCPGPTGHHSQLPWQAGPSEPRQPPAQRGSSVSKTRFNLSLPLLSQGFEDEKHLYQEWHPTSGQAGRPASQESPTAEGTPKAGLNPSPEEQEPGSAVLQHKPVFTKHCMVKCIPHVLPSPILGITFRNKHIDIGKSAIM